MHAYSTFCDSLTSQAMEAPQRRNRAPKTSGLWLLLQFCLGAAAAPLVADGQGTFQNMGFESAVIPPPDSNQPFLIPFTNAFPGWTGYAVGTNQFSAAGYNAISVGAALASRVDCDKPS